ncbi:amino acid adenylation domain-containing protein [Paenibacillus polymyxa]|uniref:amino acid adenylation domain-containing protein n=1 Tax=Paenibacillus polymyxa TaxID=1406 RepID=UPI0025B6D8B3|nr:amino acid adenylation domain-containing protein [Paenibacillus polymyxa]MDN4082523.1 amino acid adenylation domain-containing protein [Paenibacillus polymyxa]MDN4109901.1 amino acid adenylation domain-containing protein [Paenibacillus polymyxa]
MFYALTHAQKRIWYNEKIHGTTAMHNLTGLVRIQKDLELDALENAIQLFISKTEGLRIRIEEQDGEPVQYVKPYEKENIEYLDFSHETDPLQHFEQWLKVVSGQAMPLLNSKLYSFVIFQLGPNDVGYLGKFHHIIADGWALHIVSERISQYYTLLVNHRPLPADEEYSYIPIIDQEQAYLASERFIKNKMFWNEKFQTLPDMIPINKSKDISAVRSSFAIDSETSRIIQNFIQSSKLSVNVLFVSALLLYIYRTTQETDVVIGTPVLNRSGKKQKNTFGMFTSTMPFRIQVDEALDAYSWMKQVGTELMNFYFHQKYPYDLLAGDLELAQKGYDGLFDMCVNYYNMKFSPQFDGCPYEVQEVFSGYQPYALQLVIRDWEGSGRITLDFDYRVKAFSEMQIAKMFEHLMYMIREMIEQPYTPIAEIEMLSTQEHNELIYELNQTHSPYPSSLTITQLFEQQVVEKANEIVCYFEEQTLTYRELNERANQLARFLKSRGIGQESIVGIMAGHSFELIISILAVLKSGGAYLPIDPYYPADRVSFMLEDSGAALLLTDAPLDDYISFSREVYRMDDASLYDGDDSNLEPKIGPDQLAYVIYTSGSTGKPKGVAVHHKGLVNYIYWANKTYFTAACEVFACYSSIAFDLTVTSIFTPLISGHAMSLYRDDDYSEFVLFRILKDQRTTIVKLTPAHLSLLQESNIRTSNVCKFIVGGEDFKVSLARNVHDIFGGNVTLYNEYGPTETVVGCMIHIYDVNRDIRRSVPIGVPCDNVAIYVLDAYLKPVPVQVKGEIYISGPGVARGYLNRPELTKERFLDNPFVPGERMYKTGDLGIRLENGLIEYLGRKDHQVKIKGFRIELGEIEGALSSYQGIQHVVVNVGESNEDNSQPMLYAYYVSDAAVSPELLKHYLHACLPHYMVPSHIIRLDTVPLTSNGKVDKRKLPVPDLSSGLTSMYEEAHNEVENILVQVWEELFQMANIGIHDNFFALGGDSIKAIQMTSKLNNYDLEIGVQDILAHPNIAELAHYTRPKRQLYDSAPASGEILPTPISSWFMAQTFHNPHHYNQSIMLLLKNEMDRSALEKAFQKVIEHHDALRMSMEPDGKLFYNPELTIVSFKLDCYDMMHISAETRQHEFNNLVHNLQSGFDLSHRLPIRAALFDHGQETRELFITAHHLVVDGVSWRIILEDLLNAYHAIKEGEEVNFPRKTASVQAFAQELYHYSTTADLRKELEFWHEMEGGSRHFPASITSQPSATVNYASCAGFEGHLSPVQTHKLLHEMSQAYHTEPVDLLLAALALSVKEWTGLDDFTYEVEHHGRSLDHIDVSRTVGWFTALYPLRIQIPGTEIGSILAHVKELRRRVPHQGIGYGILKYMLGAIEKHTDIRPIRFNYLGQFDHESQSSDYVYRHTSDRQNVDNANHLTAAIEVNSLIVNDQLVIDMMYSTEIFEEESITEFMHMYVQAIIRIIDFTVRQQNVHFTPSDFETAQISQEDIELLFE